jgi:TraB family protein
LFGTLSTIPKEVRWSSTAVERAIGDSEEVLLPPGARAALTLNPVVLIRAWRRAREMSRNPDGRQLAEALPPDLYGRYAAVRDRYARRRSLDHLRPIIAASRVYQAAVEEMGLTSNRDVLSAIERLARRAGAEATDTQVHVDPDTLLDEAALVSTEAELDCFTKVLDIIERGENRLAARARAWASGDMDTLRRFDYPDIRKDCLAFPGWPEGLRETLRAANDKWLEAAERALSVNRSTFGAVDLRELLAPDGLLARLREQGYQVDEPTIASGKTSK